MNRTTNSRFVRGDIVALVPPKTDDKKINNQYNAISNFKPDAIIVLKPLEKSKYLVAACRNKTKSEYVEIPTSFQPLYANGKSFYVVDGSFIEPCTDLFLINKKKSVSEIYFSHNEHMREVKEHNAKIKAAEKERLRQRSEEKKQRIEQEKLKLEKYKRIYSLAVINNDRKTMAKIISVLGYDPHLGLGTNRKGGNMPNYLVNPKPYSGGSFSPK